ncbi:MAG: zf-TFIIB domain-containing protein [Pyrinomonadaceae bacterium]|jgi:Zn-finger nucleic acid-binding protein|nr:zf-TFIIB domain-containing protein [Pyrinomonadaceae bacterium]
MNCPNCKTNELYPKEIEPYLSALVCENCRGRWITSNDYDSWLKSNQHLPENPTKKLKMTIPEFELVRLCPECRRILIKYKVGQNVPFQIDRCSTCAGIWLDKGEWETLKRRSLHDDLKKIFTDHWQEEVKRGETRSHLSKMYEEKFGKEDYARIVKFKQWMDEHEKEDEIIAYLRDPNPLQF